MSRTVIGLYDSRAEAELARERLVAGVKAQSVRLIGKDTVGAIADLKISREDANAYREALRTGGQLLVAQVPSGTEPERVIELLGQSAGSGRAAEPELATEPADGEGRAETEDDVHLAARGSGRLRPVSRPAVQAKAELQPRADAPVSSDANDIAPLGRPLTATEAEASGLFQERVIEFSEMREEPVVTKEAVVREEVIVTKTIKERTEIIRDTVRRTEVEVENLESRDRAERGFFRGRDTRSS